MWSDPFDENGSIDIIGGITGVSSIHNREDVTLYPNPVQDRLFLKGIGTDASVFAIHNALGKVVASGSKRLDYGIDTSFLDEGIYSISISDNQNRIILSRKFVK